jgi:hypothetical protein
VAAPAAPALDARPARRPSWLRAALISLVVLAAGAVVGVTGYRLERAYSVQPPTVARTAGGWLVTGRPGHEFGGLSLNGPRLVWQDEGSIEFLDLREGRVVLLGPGPGMRTTWDPAVGARYAVWFEAERQASLAASAVAYDTQSGRRWTVADIGSVRSYPSISGDVAVWCSARLPGAPAINGARIRSGDTFDVAPGSGAPVVSGGLVVWATSRAGPFVAGYLAGGASWPVAADLSQGRLTGVALAGPTLVWGQTAGTAGSGVVSAVHIDGGGTTTMATGVTGLAGPAYDGRTVVWGERTATGGRVMGRRPGSGEAFVVAAVGGAVTEVAVSGSTVAFIQRTGGSHYSIVVTRLPR